MLDAHISVAIALQAFRRAARQTGVTLDAVHLARDLAHDRSRIAGSGSHFEHATPRPQLQRVDHVRDDVRLRDRLLLLDRERCIFVGKLAQIGRQVPFAMHLAHSIQDGTRTDPTRSHLAPNHIAAQTVVINVDAHARHRRRSPAHAPWTAVRRGRGIESGVLQARRCTPS